jgi:hypothetical protein
MLSALFESVKTIFYFLSISDFVGTAVDTAAFVMFPVSSIVYSYFIVRVGNYFIRILFSSRP